MSDFCLNRLQEERRAWRKNHPFGFYAKPNKAQDGGLDLMHWTIGIPGKANTMWEGGVYPVTLEFTRDYPAKPPRCQFPKGFYHPNVYPSGTICLSILNEAEDWRPGLSLKEIALGVQALLDEPNPQSPAQEAAYTNFVNNKPLYEKKVKEQVKYYLE